MALLGLTALAGKKSAATQGVGLADQRKAEYIFVQAQSEKLKGNYDAFYDLLAHAHGIDPENTAISFYLGMCMLKMSNTTPERCEHGLELMKKHFDAHPEDLYETTFYSDANMQLGHPDEALRAIKVLNERNPNRLELQVRLAEAYSRSGDYELSNATYDSIAAMFGDNLHITAGKLANYQQMNDTAGALNEVRRLLYKAPENAENNSNLANVFRHFGQMDSAFYYLDRAQQLEPDNGYFYLLRADFFDQMNDSVGYEQQIYNALTAEQLDVDTKLGVLLGYIRGHLSEQDTTQRINNLFTVLIQQHPHEARIHQLYSEYFFAMKDYGNAIEQLGYSLDVNPTDTTGWRNMVILNMMNDDYPAAIIASEKALEYNPDNIDLRRYVAGCYHQMKEYDKAIKAYQDLIKAVDTTDVVTISEILTGIGDAYSELGDSVNTMAHYNLALEFDPGNSGALNNYAYFLAQRGQHLDQAEEMAALALRYAPDNANFLDTYAWVFFAEKEYQKALTYIKKAVEKDDDNHLLEHYGDILWFNNEKDAAVEQWTKALEKDPDNELLQRKVKDKTYYDKDAID